MKSSEFKKILKPLIKQTIKEVLLEEGVLSKIVSEVAQGLQYGALMEKKQRAPRQEEILEKQRQEEILEKQRQERIRRLNESTNLNSDIFAGTAPAPADVESNSYSPMANIASHDPGVDITGIQKLANGKWKSLIGE
jgi:hypothetical protein